MAASSSDAQPGGGGASESDEERPRRAERERRFWGNAPPGILSIVMAFLPVHLLIQLQLPPLTWQHAARKQHHLTISAADEDQRSFWQRTTIALVREWATYLRQLTSIALHYPLGFPRWSLDVFVAIIEGHIVSRRAANVHGGTLQTIAIEEGVRLTGTARQTIFRTHPLLPLPLDPPPTLDALKTIADLRGDHRQLADRGWLMPSLATVVRQGWWRPGSLGKLIGSSRSLRQVDGMFDGDEWSSVFERIPAAPVGRQGGPLAQLEGIGTILVEGSDPAGIDRLQEVLMARGCRESLKQLNVEFYAGFCINRLTTPILLALRRLTMMKQLAQKATSVKYIFTQDGLTDPHTDPSPAAIDMAKTLSFDKADVVEVENAPGFHPLAYTPPPHPTIISHLQPFPKASGLSVRNHLGGAAGRLLAAKMPKKVECVDIGEMSGEEEKVGVLASLGREREVGTVEMGDIAINRLEQLLVGAADGLPTIRELRFTMTLPDDVEDAGSFVRTSLSSVISHISGLQCVEMIVRDTTTAEQRDSIEASVAVGTNIGAFTIRSIRHDGYGGTWVTMTAVLNA
ncbi:unnamed protein product [Vitrella brassicaformis CCMP3155]|uniref:Uncharacterized protein n=1 Tax=Vitrella brassicaformis (strain CCMP3155) TaxID=1169540 RepID=A0A0G4GNI4_VITBC|nr:unnamed protein product [Vitrella brassicaformis CCMP3155]|eukprot:CEM31857.1 unnamed protein product [Vitrella brassicaformis CCMP3155]